MKKNSIQIKIGLLMALAVILLSAAGYLSYLNLSSIVKSISIDVNPDLRLLRIREISMDLEKAENSIRIYSVTNDTEDLQPFYTVISGIDEKVNSLRSDCINDPFLLEQTDTISKLIEENIYIWNELLYLNHNHQVIEYLKQLSDKIGGPSVTDQKAEKGILNRVFSRSKKIHLDEEEIISNLNQIEQQDQIVKEKLIAQESQLANTSNEIKKQFYDLTVKMENEVSMVIKDKASNADILAGKTYRWLALFIISGTMLALLVMFIIVRYVRKSNAYQVALENSKDEAERLSRTKEQFMANMSHEIRTPVTAISGFTEQLLHEQFDDKTVRTLRVIKSSSDHLTRIINDILDFSKLQDGKVVLEKVHFSISKILDDVYTMFENQARRNNTLLSYSLHPDTPPVLFGDPYRLKQIMINLVSNSVKFTKEGTVHFSVRSIKKQSADIDLVMEFIDTGIGIDTSKIDIIFEDFTQEEMSTTRRFGGTGLGLSIVRKLVELLNGRIDCKSRKNEGTTITCIIPCLIGEEEQLKGDAEPPLTIPEEIRKLKILIVDDEEYNRMLFKSILDRWNINYQEAVNGLEALELIKTNKFDLLFMDVRMPGIDGIKTTQFIREELKIKDTEMPVICITAASLSGDWPKYQKAGMSAFLPKPFSEEMLLTTILSVTKSDLQFAVNVADSEAKVKPAGTDKIDLHNLFHISGGDEHFVRQMLVTFIDTTRKGLKDMQEASLSGQWESVANLSHKLLPPCRHIGATDLCTLLGSIERDIKNEVAVEEADKLVRLSLVEFETISELLREQIEKIR